MEALGTNTAPGCVRRRIEAQKPRKLKLHFYSLTAQRANTDSLGLARLRKAQLPNG